MFKTSSVLNVLKKQFLVIWTLGNTLKEYFTQNLKFCHHTHPQVVSNLYEFLFFLLNTKVDILKNMQAIDFHRWKKYYESQWLPPAVWLQHSSEYPFLCSADEKNSYRCGTTWGWVNNDRIFIFGWTIPLRECSILWNYK